MTERANICKYCTHFQKEYIGVSKEFAYILKERCEYGKDIHSESVQCNDFNKKLSYKLRELLKWWCK